MRGWPPWCWTTPALVLEGFRLRLRLRRRRSSSEFSAFDVFLFGLLCSLSPCNFRLRICCIINPRLSTRTAVVPDLDEWSSCLYRRILRVRLSEQGLTQDRSSLILAKTKPSHHFEFRIFIVFSIRPCCTISSGARKSIESGLRPTEGSAFVVGDPSGHILVSAIVQ